MFRPQPNPVGALGILATAAMAGAGILGFAHGNKTRRRRLGLESDTVLVPKPTGPAPGNGNGGQPEPQPAPPSDDTKVTYVTPTDAERAACGGNAECWVDNETGERTCRCVGNTEPAGGDATKCPAGYFYDALHKVCCPDGYFFDPQSRTCKPMKFAPNPRRYQQNP